MRASRNDANAEILAFHLLRSQLLWRRPLPYAGLINSIAAPQLDAAGCTWRACSRDEGRLERRGVGVAAAGPGHGAEQPVEKERSHLVAKHVPVKAAWSGLAPDAFGRAEAAPARVR